MVDIELESELIHVENRMRSLLSELVEPIIAKVNEHEKVLEKLKKHDIKHKTKHTDLDAFVHRNIIRLVPIEEFNKKIFEFFSEARNLEASTTKRLEHFSTNLTQQSHHVEYLRSTVRTLEEVQKNNEYSFKISERMVRESKDLLKKQMAELENVIKKNIYESNHVFEKITGKMDTLAYNFHQLHEKSLPGLQFFIRTVKDSSEGLTAKVERLYKERVTMKDMKEFKLRLDTDASNIRAKLTNELKTMSSYFDKALKFEISGEIYNVLMEIASLEQVGTLIPIVQRNLRLTSDIVQESKDMSSENYQLPVQTVSQLSYQKRVFEKQLKILEKRKLDLERQKILDGDPASMSIKWSHDFTDKHRTDSSHAKDTETEINERKQQILKAEESLRSRKSFIADMSPIVDRSGRNSSMSSHSQTNKLKLVNEHESPKSSKSQLSFGGQTQINIKKTPKNEVQTVLDLKIPAHTRNSLLYDNTGWRDEVSVPKIRESFLVVPKDPKSTTPVKFDKEFGVGARIRKLPEKSKERVERKLPLKELERVVESREGEAKQTGRAESPKEDSERKESISTFKESVSEEKGSISTPAQSMPVSRNSVSVGKEGVLKESLVGYRNSVLVKKEILGVGRKNNSPMVRMEESKERVMSPKESVSLNQKYQLPIKKSMNPKENLLKPKDKFKFSKSDQEKILLSNENNALAAASLPQENSNLPKEDIQLSEETPAPTESVMSPKENLHSLRETLISPKENITSPKEDLQSLRETLISPKESITSPKENLQSLRETLIFPKESITSPKESIFSQSDSFYSQKDVLRRTFREEFSDVNASADKTSEKSSTDPKLPEHAYRKITPEDLDQRKQELEALHSELSKITESNSTTLKATQDNLIAFTTKFIEEEIKKLHKVKEDALETIQDSAATVKNMLINDQAELRLNIRLIYDENRQLIKQRNADMQKIDTELKRIATVQSEHAAELASNREELNSQKNFQSCLLETVKILFSLIKQDEKDRESLQLTAYSETRSKSVTKHKPNIMLRPECLSCSGQASSVYSAFKVACLNYQPSDVSFKKRLLPRHSLIYLLGQYIAHINEFPSYVPDVNESKVAAREESFVKLNTKTPKISARYLNTSSSKISELESSLKKY